MVTVMLSAASAVWLVLSWPHPNPAPAGLLAGGLILTYHAYRRRDDQIGR